MSSDESYRERQDNEFESLQSIFGDELEDVRGNDAWKVYRPPEFILKLKPQEGMSGKKEAYSKLDLRVKFPPTYPSCCPELKIEHSTGLSIEEVSRLSKKLNDFAKSSVGEVMILPIACLVQEFLHSYNVQPFESAYEEMVRNKERQLEREAKEEEKKNEIKRRKEEKQRREIEEELARRQEEERKLRKIKREERDMPRFAGSGQSGSVVCLGLDASSGEIVAIHHWEIPCPDRNSLLTAAERSKLDKYLKSISTVEQEIQALVKLSHKHLVAFLGMKSTNCGNSIEVDILQEYVKGISIQQKVASKEKVPLDALRSYTEQMLLAIDYLHDKSVVHKHFKTSSVFLDSSGTIKVADFSVSKRLADMYRESRIAQPGVTFSDDRIPTRTSKKGDLLRLGIVVLSLAQGCDVTDYPPEISSGFPPIFQDFVTKCCFVDERIRCSARELLEHEFIKPSISPIDVTADIPPGDILNESFDDILTNTYIQPTLSPAGRNLQVSRLHTEFEHLHWLGKGGYGDVVKVRNKLDDRFYAIKRILLNPNEFQLNRKITREVKLLSRLNHENVVRYYNSWMETSQVPKEEWNESSSSLTIATTDSKNGAKPGVEYSKNSLGLPDNVELMAPPAALSGTSEWSVSVEDISRHGDVDDEDDEDVFPTIYVNNEESSSDGIQFERCDDDSSSFSGDNKQSATLETTSDTTGSSSSMTTKRFLLIQMEYCEKSTLRQTIDDGLCHETDRMWRLFREILDGLAHVHEQGMIHRDLKPQNIFLDQNDHVKIGDFGLATAHARAVSVETSEDLSSRSEVTDSMLTGAVGTALYVAPELLSSSKRTLYTQKVDIYSVGIIFFEMCYPGIKTKMERVKILGNLRTSSINFPNDFDEATMDREAIITRWCLDHDHTRRPTASELLKCRHVPTPILEESHVLEAVKEMMVDPNSKQHSLVMNVIFDQPVNATTAAVYDIEMQKRQFTITSSVVQQQAYEKVASILRRHGAVCVNTPLLLSKQVPEMEISEAATFMDTGGTVVVLPYNLRVPFARFILCNGITSIKRYAIEKVYKARRVRCVRPKELWECAFDIVTPGPGNLIPDAEVISVVSEIISNFPALTARKYEVRINHLRLLKAVLIHCGLEEQHHSQALAALCACDRWSKSQTSAAILSSHLSNLPLNEQQVASLISFVKIHGQLSDLQIKLRSITRSKTSKAASMARQGLQELEKLKKYLGYLQLSLPVTFDLGFSHKHQQHFCDVIFQVCATIQRKKQTAIEVFAMGGRYDQLLESTNFLTLDCFRSVSKDGDVKYTRPCAVGVSIAIDKVVAAMAAEGRKNELSPDTSSSASPVDVLLCVVGHSLMLKERLCILKSLWDASITAETSYHHNPSEALQDIQEKAQERGVQHIVLLSEKDHDFAVVKSFSDSKVTDKKIRLEKLVEYLSLKIRDVEEGSASLMSIKSSSQAATSASLSSGDSSTQSSSHGGTRQISIELLPPEKLPHYTKKRYEFEIGTKLSDLCIIECVSVKTLMCAIAVDLPSTVMKQLACALDISHKDEDFNTSVAQHLSSASKYKKYLSSITDKIHEVKFERSELGEDKFDLETLWKDSVPLLQTDLLQC